MLEIDGELKNKILKINNQVNMDVFGRGLKEQKIHTVGNNILIISKNIRVPALATLDNQGVSTREMDLALLDIYKKRLKEEIKDKLNLPALSVLKDYDPVNEISINMIILEQM